MYQFFYLLGDANETKRFEPSRSQTDHLRFLLMFFKFHYTSTRVTYYSQGTSDLFSYVRLSQKNVINDYKF